MTHRALPIVLAVSLLVLLAGCGHSRVVKREGARPAPRAEVQPLPRSGDYVVRRGDTLYGIAFRHGLDYRDVASLNRIAPPYTIYPGQRIRLQGVRAADPGPVVVRTPATGPAPAPTPSRPVTSPSRPPASGGPAPATPPATPAPAPTPMPATVAGWRWPTQGQVVGRFAAGDPKRQGLDIAGRAGQPVLAAAPGTVVYSGSGLVGYGELIIIKHNDEWISAYAHNRTRLVAEGSQVAAGQQIAELGRSGTSRDMLHFEVRRNGKPVDPLTVLPPP